MTVSWIEMVLRLAAATIFGGLVGYQREKAEKPAGLRTHVLVCLGSALIMQISVYPFEGKPYADLTRIAAGVVVGIGFLGAGTIIRQGSIVMGLTTAASLWATAGVGLAIGIGFYIPAAATIVLILLALTFLKAVEIRIPKEHKIVNLIARDQPGQLGKIGATLGDLDINIKNIELECEEQSGLCYIKLALDSPTHVRADIILEKLSKIEGVNNVTWES
jgi:putative Mg2+ transporter-C (MgtC) family protein